MTWQQIDWTNVWTLSIIFVLSLIVMCIVWEITDRISNKRTKYKDVVWKKKKRRETQREKNLLENNLNVKLKKFYY
jgi:type III secretory pathway component EscR